MPAIEIGWHRVVEDGPWRFLVEVVGAPSRLIAFGAGHDATPLAASAAQLGFEVIVADERRQFLTEERFASAKELIQVEAGGLAAAIGPDPRTYVVLMSHNYLRDLAALWRAGVSLPRGSADPRAPGHRQPGPRHRVPGPKAVRPDRHVR